MTQHYEFSPPEGLEDSIRCFWYNRQDYGALESGMEVVPDGYAEIIFHFGNGCKIAGEYGLQSLPSPFMIGLLDQPVHFFSEGVLEIMGIRCFPWTVFDLLGMNAGPRGVETFCHPIAEMQSSLAEHVQAGRISEAIAEVQSHFSEIRSNVAADTMLAKAGRAMQLAHGTLPVREVAEAAHATIRTLERRFRQSSGHTVKDVSALMRFEQVRNRLWQDPGSNLAGIAHEFGYADQSHLTREFKRYAGTTPAAFVRNAKRNRVALIRDFVAFVQA